MEKRDRAVDAQIRRNKKKVYEAMQIGKTYTITQLMNKTGLSEVTVRNALTNKCFIELHQFQKQDGHGKPTFHFTVIRNKYNRNVERNNALLNQVFC